MTQRGLSQKVHEHTIQNLDKGDLRERAHRASLGLAGAKDWLMCQPSPALLTHIPDRDFRLAMRYHCGVRLFNDAFPCPREGCTDTVDPHGDHLITCHYRVSPGNAPLHWRHNSIVRVLAACLKRASRNPTVEPRTDTARTRPDIKADGADGGTEFFDVTIAHPLTSTSRMAQVERWPDTILKTASTKKHAKYHEFVQGEGQHARLHPIALTSLGGWHPDARAYFERVCDGIAGSSQVPRRFVHSLIFHRSAAKMVRLMCRSLTEGVADAI